jgi:hypothetical protein
MAEQPAMEADIVHVPQNKSPMVYGGRGLEIRTIDDAWRYANMFIQSGMAPKGDTPQAIVIKMDMGATLGLDKMAAIQNIAVINGKPGLYGDGMLGVVMSSSVFDLEQFREYWDGEGDNLTAHSIMCRKGGQPVEQTFSVADAKRAGLWGKAGPWSQYPRRMLMWRARSFVARDLFPDVLRGIRSAEELMDFVDVPAQVIETGRQPFNGDSASGALPAPSSTVSALEKKLAAQRQASEQARSKPAEQPTGQPEAKPAAEQKPAPASAPKSGTKNRTSTPKQTPPAQAPAAQVSPTQPEAKADPLDPDPSVKMPEPEHQDPQDEPAGDGGAGAGASDGLESGLFQEESEPEPQQPDPAIEERKAELWKQASTLVARLRGMFPDAAKRAEITNQVLSFMDKNGTRGKKSGAECSLDGIEGLVQDLEEYEQQLTASLPPKK